MSELTEQIDEIKHEVNNCFVPSRNRNIILKDIDAALVEAAKVEETVEAKQLTLEIFKNERDLYKDKAAKLEGERDKYNTTLRQIKGRICFCDDRLDTECDCAWRLANKAVDPKNHAKLEKQREQALEESDMDTNQTDEKSDKVHLKDCENCPYPDRECPECINRSSIKPRLKESK